MKTKIRLLLQEITPLLKLVVTTYQEILDTIDAEGGFLKLPFSLETIIERYGLQKYPELYLKPNAVKEFALQFFLGERNLQSVVDEIDGMNQESEKLAELRGILQSMLVLAGSFDEIDSDRGLAIVSAFRQGKTEANEEMIRDGQRLFLNFIVGLHEYLSVMVHGEKLSVLVDRAIAGDDTAYGLAIQTDIRILTGIPYFSDRLHRARLEGDVRFLNMFGSRGQKPVLTGRKIRHEYYLALSIFHDLGYLDRTVKNRDLLDACDAAGVGGDNPITDVAAFAKIRSAYVRAQKDIEKSTQ